MTTKEARARIAKLHNQYPLGVPMPANVCDEINRLIDWIQQAEAGK